MQYWSIRNISFTLLKYYNLYACILYWLQNRVQHGLLVKADSTHAGCLGLIPSADRTKMSVGPCYKCVYKPRFLVPLDATVNVIFFIKVGKCGGVLDVLGKLYKCQYQHVYSRLTLISHTEIQLINCSDSDSEQCIYLYSWINMS